MDGMNLDRITQRLAGLADKRAFCRTSQVPERTVWRIISGQCNPTHATLQKIALALKKVKG
jgi:predicted transcriptional regulator